MERYKIVYRTGIKWVPGGGILRQEANGTYYLKSEIGVRRFCQELSPFVSITIKDNGKDCTSDFTGDFQIVPSRYLAFKIRQGGQENG
jgi:hypothetical protein